MRRMAASKGNVPILSLWGAQWTLLTLLLVAGDSWAGSILFIGNSFTFAYGNNK